MILRPCSSCKDDAIFERVIRLRTDIVNFDGGKFTDWARGRRDGEGEPCSSPPSVLKFLKAVKYIKDSGDHCPDIHTEEAIRKKLESFCDPNSKENPILEEKLKSEAFLIHKANLPPLMVFTAKHLCGAGTDVALNLIKRIRDRDPLQPILAVIQPCCFHACDESSLTNCSMVKELFGETPLTMPDLIHYVGWSNGHTDDWQTVGRRIRFIFLAAR